MEGKSSLVLEADAWGSQQLDVGGGLKEGH